MKLRVVKIWHKTCWLYRVDKETFASRFFKKKSFWKIQVFISGEESEARKWCERTLADGKIIAEYEKKPLNRGAL